MEAGLISKNNFKKRYFLNGLLGIYASIWIWAAINPVYPYDWFLENILTFVVIFSLIITYKIIPLTNQSYTMIAIFMSLHALGSHYTYAETPLGFWVQEWLSLSRNHYDRLVHFCFGLLILYPMREIILRTVTLNKSLASWFAFSLLVSFSTSFEIIEWIVAVIVDPKAGAAYLGTQGDEFDAQKDMVLAFLGGAISLALISRYTKLTE